MYLLFGGVAKIHPDIKIRGEINVLLVGDPGIAKSLLLQASAKLAPRGLYTSGRGTTAAGLTAAVLKDKSGGMNLEAGALVLADKGIACIDELDKMKTEDRSAMHEALEQHTVSIAKAGIVATLNARTAVLAAANPKWGRYDTSRTIGENVELPITLLSRFDLVFIMIDKPDRAQDTEMSTYILDSHGRTEAVVTQVPLDLLRQYISYARQLKPRLTAEAKKVIQDYFLKLRDMGADRTGPIAITPRQLEGLIRIAEAHARIALQDKVTVADAQAAVAIFNESMVQVCFDAATGKMDRDILDTGAAKSTHDKLKVAYAVVIDLEKEAGFAETEVVYKELEKKGVSRDEAEALIDMLYRDNKIFEPKPGYLKKV
jgi:replicative DNA helicase Mcm